MVLSSGFSAVVNRIQVQILLVRIRKKTKKKEAMVDQAMPSVRDRGPNRDE